MTLDTGYGSNSALGDAIEDTKAAFDVVWPPPPREERAPDRPGDNLADPERRKAANDSHVMVSTLEPVFVDPAAYKPRQWGS